MIAPLVYLLHSLPSYGRTAVDSASPPSCRAFGQTVSGNVVGGVAEVTTGAVETRRRAPQPVRAEGGFLNTPEGPGASGQRLETSRVPAAARLVAACEVSGGRRGEAACASGAICAYVSGNSVTCRLVGRWLSARPLEHRKGAEGSSCLREWTVQEGRPVPAQWPWQPGLASRGPNTWGRGAQPTCVGHCARCFRTATLWSAHGDLQVVPRDCSGR